MCVCVQLAESVQQEQEAAENGIGSNGRPVVTKVRQNHSICLTFRGGARSLFS